MLNHVVTSVLQIKSKILLALTRKEMMDVGKVEGTFMNSGCAGIYNSNFY